MNPAPQKHRAELVGLVLGRLRNRVFRRHSDPQWGGVKWWALTAAYGLLIAVTAVVPVPEKPAAAVPWLDKAAHLCEYLLFAWCVARATCASGSSRRTTLAVSVWCAAAYGAVLEGVQFWLPYRSAEWGDLLANTVGAGVGAWLWSRR